jgi:signal peptidase I
MNKAAVASRLQHWWRKEIRPLLVLALILFSIRSSLADWNDVPTGSMKPTILEGDRVFVNKLAYDLKVPFTTWHVAQWGNPQRGDIVVFFSPYDGKRLVKRVVGLPGDTLELRQNVLFLNGKPLDYQALPPDGLRNVAPADLATHVYATEDLAGVNHAVALFPAVAARRDFGPINIPADRFFMMGDNRDDSFDSRYYGTVERRQIVGQATAVVLSLDHTRLWKPRWDRFFRSLQS